MAIDRNQITLIQWREPGDDEDSLETFAYAAGETPNSLADIRAAYDIPVPEDEADSDVEGCIIVSNEFEIKDGEIIEHAGRRFRVRIEEVI